MACPADERRPARNPAVAVKGGMIPDYRKG